jgi:hypothetical protein
MPDSMNPKLVESIFTFGIRVAEHIHGVRRSGEDAIPKTDAIFDAVREIASGDLTLLGTPEEIIAQMPKPPAWLKVDVLPDFQEWVRISRDQEKSVAVMVSKAMSK